MGILLLYCKQFTLAPQNMVIFHRLSPTFASKTIALKALFCSVIEKKRTPWATASFRDYAVTRACVLFLFLAKYAGEEVADRREESLHVVKHLARHLAYLVRGLRGFRDADQLLLQFIRVQAF